MMTIIKYGEKTQHFYDAASAAEFLKSTLRIPTKVVSKMEIIHIKKINKI